ncbi:hypothetical protein G9A89_021622 [Geosiphon pyriformis]|nr:hypothetical protein G9A89_021622 [Geosiphon pyriformis]
MWSSQAIGQWYFKSSDFDLTPSRKEGISLEDENNRRAKGVKFLQEVSFELKLPQITIATAATFLHRFYMRRSLKKFHQYDVAGTCVFEACKTEETGRKMDDVARVCAKKAQKNPLLDDEAEFAKWRHTINKHEIIVLEALMFDLHIEHPYRTLLEYAKELKNDRAIENEGAKKLAQSAWAIVNDSLRITVCLRHRPNVVASAAIYMAAKLYNIRLNDDTSVGTIWWEIVNADIKEIADAVNIMLDNYITRPKLIKEGRSGENGGRCKSNPLHFECTKIVTTRSLPAYPQDITQPPINHLPKIAQNILSIPAAQSHQGIASSQDKNSQDNHLPLLEQKTQSSDIPLDQFPRSPRGSEHSKNPESEEHVGPTNASETTYANSMNSDSINEDEDMEEGEITEEGEGSQLDSNNSGENGVNGENRALDEKVWDAEGIGGQKRNFDEAIGQESDEDRPRKRFL